MSEDLSQLTDRQLLLRICQTLTTHQVELEGIRSSCSRLEDGQEAIAGKVDALIADTRRERLERKRELALARIRIQDLEEELRPRAAVGG